MQCQFFGNHKQRPALVSKKMLVFRRNSGVHLAVPLALLALGVLSAAALHYECPEPVDIFPCYCEEEDEEAMMFCNHFWKPDQIYKSIRGLKKNNGIYKMSFFMNRILEPVNADAFKDAPVERIMFENSTVTLLAPQFSGLEDYLVSLQMRATFNKTNPVGSWSLSHLTKLKELIFDKNKIMTLEDDWLASAPKSLRSISLENNNIITLGDKVFTKATNVMFLILDGNRLTAMKRSMFPSPAESLRSLSLNFNRLRYLPYDLFVDMPNLRIIEIQHNRLTTLEEPIWSVMWSQLSKLDLSENPLECDRSLKWIVSADTKPVLLYGECQAPEKLKNKSLKSLTMADFS
ncbi:protein slit-like [Argiope bruennichi]|uniref:Protein slit like protein n=1 Tax=Argiope bruennichi TaxID=94029 RepID=A0A8T0FPS4_ARGBR|nr:protein slit-like [Argiope bruennichi]KAF8791629.1 Protein slit like protein [Argiope bruennichi]